MSRGTSPILVGVHIFGSRRGYGTLARSPDVDEREDAALSGIGFGQATDARALASLSHAVTAIGRVLPGGRFAITRAMPGGADDAGRPTLLLCTLLVPPEAYLAHVRHHLADLLADSTLWDQQHLIELESRRSAPSGAMPIAAVAPISITLPPAPRRAPTAQDVAIADAWLRATELSDTIALLPSGSESALLCFPQVLAPEDALRFRWGVRLLGLDAGADVATTLPGVGRGRRRVLSCELDAPPTSEWLTFLVSQGTLATPLVLRRATTRVEETAGRAERLLRPHRGGRAISRWVVLMFAGVGASLLLIVAILVVVVMRGQEHRDAINVSEAPVPIDTASDAPPDPAVAASRERATEAPPERERDVDGEVSPGAGDVRRERPVGPSNPAHAARDRARESLVGPPAPDDAALPSDPPTGADSGERGEGGEGDPSSDAPSSDDSLTPSTPGAERTPSAEARLRELVQMREDARRGAIEFGPSLTPILSILSARLDEIESDGLLVLPAESEQLTDARLSALRERTEEAARLAAVAASVAESLLRVWRAQVPPGPGEGSREPLSKSLEDFASALRAARSRDGSVWNSPEQMRPILEALPVASDSLEHVIRSQGLVHAINSRLKAIPGAESLDVPLPVDARELDELRIARDRFARDFGLWSKRRSDLLGSGGPR